MSSTFPPSLNDLERWDASDLMPSSALLLAFPTPRAHDGYQTTNDGGEFGRRFPEDRIGTWIEWEVSIKAGTYILLMNAARATFAGIVTFSMSIDGEEYIDIDQPPYSASTATVDQYDSDNRDFWKYQVCSDLTIKRNGIYIIRVTTTGKNPSSSGHFGNICWLYLYCTDSHPGFLD